MKYLVFTDVHNHLEDLKSIPSICYKEEIENILFLWDLDGMWFFHMQILKEQLQEININLFCILWNHCMSWYEYFMRTKIKNDRPSVLASVDREWIDMAWLIKYSDTYKYVRLKTLEYLNSVLNTTSITIEDGQIEFRHALQYWEHISWTLWLEYSALSHEQFRKRFPSLFRFPELWYATYGTHNDSNLIQEYYWEKILNYNPDVVRKNLSSCCVRISGHEHHSVVFWSHRDDTFYGKYVIEGTHDLSKNELWKLWAYEKWVYAIISMEGNDLKWDKFKITIKNINELNADIVKEKNN